MFPGSRWIGASGTTYIVQEVIHNQVWGLSGVGTPWNELVDMVPKLYRPLTDHETINGDDTQSSTATARAVATTTTGVDMPDKDAAYEAAKTNWIAQHGSRRLRLAYERGYRIDTLYRDERLARELPDCKALRRPKTKDIVNPSEEALDLEDDFHGRGFPDARLVFVTDSDDSDHGEAVEIPGVFGKFTVYAMVADDDA